MKDRADVGFLPASAVCKKHKGRSGSKAMEQELLIKSSFMLNENEHYRISLLKYSQ